MTAVKLQDMKSNDTVVVGTVTSPFFVVDSVPGVQTDIQGANAVQQLQQLREENAALREEVRYRSRNTCFDLHLIEGNDKKTRFYTGLPTYSRFEALFAYLESEAKTMVSGHDKTKWTCTSVTCVFI